MSEETSDRLDDIIAECISAEESGEPMDRQELLAQHPDLADDLRQFFANRDKFQQLALPLGPVSSSNRPLPAKIRYFGDYELLEEIARGGMGVVYKSRQTSLNRIVAVKMILAGHLASEGALRTARRMDAVQMVSPSPPVMAVSISSRRPNSPLRASSRSRARRSAPSWWSLLFHVTSQRSAQAAFLSR